MNDITPPTDPSFEDQLAEVFQCHQSGDYAKAESLYRQLILKLPNIWQLYFNLGLLLYDLRRYDEALEFYLKGSAITDNSNDLLYNTAICQKELGLFVEAIESYKRALVLEPEDIDCRYNLAGCYRAMGDDETAALTYTTILKTNPTHLPSLNNLAFLCHKNGDIKRAQDIYLQILKVSPDHVFADHMLAALSGDKRESAPDSYIKEVFDQFSDHYESSLTDKLHYNLPSKLLDFSKSSLQLKKFDRMLDLGCGTGLVGELFSSVCSSMSGVDISEKMLAIAAEKQLYESLSVSEIVSFLKQNQSASFDLIVSADVFPYIGDLKELFDEAGKAITTIGNFIFSVEHLEEDDSRPNLRQSGRFAHSRSYILETAAAAGWRLTASEGLDLRMEKGEWIRGCIYALNRF